MPALLSPSELTSLRAYAATMLPDDCTIRAATRTPDGMGSSSAPFADVATVKCAAIGPQAGQEVTIDSRIGALAIWIILLTWGTAVVEGNQLVIGGHTLTVQADLTPKSYAAVVEVRASEVK